MKLLLDTHTFLWFIVDDHRLTPAARSFIEADDSEVYLSVASLWELAIKFSLGRLSLGMPGQSLEAEIDRQLGLNDILVLGIDKSHALAVASLPLHHRDPFDRMLVAQSLVEGMPLVSADEVLDQYTIERLW